MRADRVREHATEVGRRLLFADDPDPRVLQARLHRPPGPRLPAPLRRRLPDPAAVLAGHRVRAGPRPHRRNVPGALAPAAARGHRPSSPSSTSLAISLARLDDRGSAAAAVIVVPALWLGRQFGKRGAVRHVRRRPGPDRRAVGPLPRHRRGQPVPLADGAARRRLDRARARQRHREDRTPGTPRPKSGAAELALALHTIDEQRRFAEAILDTVDVGLVLLDHTRRLPDPEQAARRLHAAGLPGRARRHGRPARPRLRTPTASTRLTREEMPTYRASPRRGVRRLPDLGRRRPADPPGAVGLGPLRPRRGRRRSPAPRWPTRTSPTSCARSGSRTSSSPRSPTSCAPR